MKVYLLWASSGDYDDRKDWVIGVYTKRKKAEEAKSKFDEEHKTSDCYWQILTGLTEVQTDVMGEW